MEEYTKDNLMQQSDQRKGFRLFYLFPLLYIISVYLLAVFVLMEDNGGIASYLKYLPLLFGFVNIVVSIVFCKAENRIMMLNATVMVKYALIPFFIVGGIVVIASFFLSFIPVPFMIFLGPMITAIGAVGGWVVLALEAPYAIAYLRLSSKAKIRSKAMTIFHSLLQFFFTIDVIDVMILTWRENRWRKLTMGIIMLLALEGVALLLFVVLGVVTAFI